MSNFGIVLQQGEALKDYHYKNLRRKSEQELWGGRKPRRKFQKSKWREISGPQSFLKRKRRIKSNHVPVFQETELGEMLLKEARLSIYGNKSMRGLYFDPYDEDPLIVGSIIILPVIETGEVVINLDKNKQIIDPVTKEAVSERWSFPGGKREENENTLWNILRETKEETHLDLVELGAPIKRVGSIRLRGARGSELARRVKAAVFYAPVTKAAAQTAIASKLLAIASDPNDEQLDIRLVMPSDIEFLVEEMRDPRSGIKLLHNQAFAWRLCMSWRMRHLNEEE